MRHCATCKCDHGPICGCGHQITSHDLAWRTVNKIRALVRTACSVHTGPKGTPCGCPLFTPREPREEP